MTHADPAARRSAAWVLRHVLSESWAVLVSGTVRRNAARRTERWRGAGQRHQDLQDQVTEARAAVLRAVQAGDGVDAAHAAYVRAFAVAEAFYRVGWDATAVYDGPGRTGRATSPVGGFPGAGRPDDLEKLRGEAMKAAETDWGREYVADFLQPLRDSLEAEDAE